MTEEDRKYFEEQLGMFSTPGWKFFISQVEDMRESTDRISGCDADSFRVKQGELNIISWILGWPKMIADEYNLQLLGEEEPSDANL